jgi:hypothetical protein
VSDEATLLLIHYNEYTEKGFVMREFDNVILNVDLPEHNLKAGTPGVIVDDQISAGEAFIVEFFDGDGATLDVVVTRAGQLTVTLADFFEGESIALLHDQPVHRLQRGQVGVIRSRLGNGVYEVEFADGQGAAYARAVLHAQQMLLLHWQQSPVLRTA